MLFSCSVSVSTIPTSQLLYSFQNMKSKEAAVQRLLFAIVAIRGTERFASQALDNALYDLQGMHSYRQEMFRMICMVYKV